VGVAFVSVVERGAGVGHRGQNRASGRVVDCHDGAVDGIGPDPIDKQVGMGTFD
jgi:hypothetical protein